MDTLGFWRGWLLLAPRCGWPDRVAGQDDKLRLLALRWRPTRMSRQAPHQSKPKQNVEVESVLVSTATTTMA